MKEPAGLSDTAEQDLKQMVIRHKYLAGWALARARDWIDHQLTRPKTRCAEAAGTGRIAARA